MKKNSKADIENYIYEEGIEPDKWESADSYIERVKKKFRKHYNWAVEEIALDKWKEKHVTYETPPKEKKEKKKRIRKSKYRGKKVIGNELAARIRALRQQGLSRDKISQQLHVGHDTVQRVLNLIKS